ncbi:MAG: hypothetical protein ACE5OO_02560, partial [Candidatus Bathyarchaeia archaeon]
ISTFSIRVALPEKAELERTDAPFNFTESLEDGVWTLEYESEALTPLQDKNATVYYKPSPKEEYLIDCELMQRSISILAGRLRMEDTYTLTSRGSRIDIFHLRLPEDAYEVEARDGVGPLKAFVDRMGTEEQYVDLYITSRSSIQPGGRWSVTVRYLLPKKGRIEGEGGRFTLTYPASGFPHYVRRLAVIVTLPEGGGFITSSPEPDSVRKISAFTQQALIDLGGVTPSENPTVTVEYRWSPVWSAFRPLTWTLLAAGFAASVIVLKRRKRVEEVKPAAARRTVREEFLELYKERISLLAETEELERLLERKEMSRRAFDQRSAEINRRQQELLRSLRRMERRLEAADPRMSERLQEIREAEAELERAITDLRNLEVRRRTRRVTRRDYQRRRRDYIKRRSQARRRIEQSILRLLA